MSEPSNVVALPQSEASSEELSSLSSKFVWDLHHICKLKLYLKCLIPNTNKYYYDRLQLQILKIKIVFELGGRIYLRRLKESLRNIKLWWNLHVWSSFLSFTPSPRLPTSLSIALWRSRRFFHIVLRTSSVLT